MKYNVGDKVRIKSLDWYNENKDEDGDVPCGDFYFVKGMKKFCSEVFTISEDVDDGYLMLEDSYGYVWTDEMIEELVEEDVDLIPKFGEFSDNEPLDISTMTTDFVKEHGLPCPEGYQFVDENGNEILTSKIILEKKKEVIPNLQLDSIRTVREYCTEYSRIWLEIYEDDPKVCVFTHLLVDEDYRQKGYGTKALKQAEIIAKDLGCNTIYLKVETDSWMSKWYLRSGYKFLTNAEDNYTWLTKSI